MEKRTLSYDILRIIAILGVIISHSDEITTSVTNYVGGATWWMVVFIDTLFRISVPFFVLLSGALAFPKVVNSSYAQVWQRILHRLLIPFVFWTAFYGWWQWRWKGIAFTFASFIDNLFFSPSGFLYFIVLVIGLYAISPCLKPFLTFSNKQKTRLVFCLFLAASLYSTLLYFLLDKSEPGFSLLLFLPYTNYYLFGYISQNIKLKTKTAWGLLGIALVIVLLNSIFFYITLKHFNSGQTIFWAKTSGYYFWNTFSLPIIATTILFWLGLKQLLENLVIKVFIKNILAEISKASYGMYLIHGAVITLVDHYGHMAIHLIKQALYFAYFKKILMVFILSYILAAILKRLPVARLIVGEK
ncbi:acyltransferase family protein [Candidatus Beckwithbacteria bacterium]|nr:acyltransferase family protein [Candidatus Beckwithbacteria bacterium]